MRAYSLTELFNLSRRELFALHAEILAKLVRFPAESPDRATALANLRNIRRVLTHPGLSPG